MVRIALGLEYDGSQFHGWQRQSEILSVQETLEEALSFVANHPVQTICAGRTDSRVHATNQVVHFDTTAVRTERAWILGTNAHLPSSVRALWVRVVPSTFNARRSATAREYRYIIYNHPIRPSLLRHYVSWHYQKLDVQKMQEGAKHWLGQHDFSSFRASQCQSLTPIRSIYAILVERRGDKVIFTVKANAFLHHMVRNMAGVLMSIGEGLAPPERALEVLLAKDRLKADVTASPNGLYLVSVEYPEVYGLPVGALGPWWV